MHRFLAIALLISVLATPMVAQDDQLDNLDFEQMQLTEEAIPYFAVGVGLTGTFGWYDMAAVNDRATQLQLPGIEAPMFQLGGDIFTAIGVVRNVRLGFSWITGVSKSNAQVTLPNDAVVQRHLDYTNSLFNLYADYAFVPAKSLAILPGAAFGWGTQAIETYQSVEERTWNDYVDPNGRLNTAPDDYSKLQHSVLVVTPRVNIEYGITPFLMVRAQAAYQVQVSSGNWKGNNHATVTGVPDGINVNGFSAQIGLFVGLFN